MGQPGAGLVAARTSRRLRRQSKTPRTKKSLPKEELTEVMELLVQALQLICQRAHHTATIRTQWERRAAQALQAVDQRSRMSHHEEEQATSFMQSDTELNLNPEGRWDNSCYELQARCQQRCISCGNWAQCAFRNALLR